MSQLPNYADPLRGLLGGDPTRPKPFPATSRYANSETTTMTDADGRTVVFLKQRLVPDPSRFAELREVTVRQGDRLDNLAAEHLGDPELFWQLCDANGALRPEELEELGRKLRITLPVDTPGPSRA